jgi:hypothetical protein
MAAENGFWIDAPEVVRLFPTFVWKCQLRPEVYRAIMGTLRLNITRRANRYRATVGHHSIAHGHLS